MKTKHVLVVMITSFFLLYGCSNNEDIVEKSVLSSEAKTDGFNGSSVIHQTYPQAQAEVLETFTAIAQSITDGAGTGKYSEFMNQLISFHAYGDKFVEFNNGEVYDSEGNEINERTLFGTIVDPGGVQKFAAVPGTLKVAVYYGNVANLTFVSDFELLIGGTLHSVNDQITLLFVKTKGEWKMVHEHHSPAHIEEPKLSSKKTYLSKNSVTDQAYSQAQQEVMATFGAIGKSITLGAGHGKDGEYMNELISFHAYGPKFTEFNEGQSFNSAENELNERTFFGETVDIGGVKRFAPLGNSLKIAVYYGNVANLTFISDFHLEIGGTLHEVNNLITLLFVKTKGEWKIVHEHHSPYTGPNPL